MLAQLPSSLPSKRTLNKSILNRRLELRLTADMAALADKLYKAKGYRSRSAYLRALLLIVARQARAIEGLGPRALPDFLERLGLDVPQLAYTPKERQIHREEARQRPVDTTRYIDGYGYGPPGSRYWDEYELAEWKEHKDQEEAKLRAQLEEEKQRRPTPAYLGATTTDPIEPAQLLEVEAKVETKALDAPQLGTIEEASAPIELAPLTPRFLELAVTALATLPSHTLERLARLATSAPIEEVEAQLELSLALYNPAPLAPGKRRIWRNLS